MLVDDERRIEEHQDSSVPGELNANYLQMYYGNFVSRMYQVYFHIIA